MISAPTSKERSRTSLFWRILFRLSLLFFVLGALVAAIQLTNQIQTLNEIYRIESQWAFDNFHKQLSISAHDAQNIEELRALGQKTARWKNLYHFKEVGIFNALDLTSLLDSPASPWTEADTLAFKRSLEGQKKGTPYLITVRKDTRQIAAYFPFEGPDNAPYVARALFPLASTRQAILRSYGSLGSMLFFILLTVLIIGNSLAGSIIKPIQALNRATREMMNGHLGMHVDIRTGDEIESLARTFNEMSDAMKEMKTRAEDANPLTGLQGNKSIFNELQKRIHERQKFVLFHVDLDRFKIFNDHYGLANGDLAIKRTADVLKKVASEMGAADDFVGHQGGDDFVMITRPKRALELSAEICRRFDAEVVASLYGKEDLERGHTLHLDRRRQAETGEEVMREFPLLSVSLAGVSTAKKDFADYFDFFNVVSEVKKEVKKI
ncbi:MAG TPA: GGDEF domain-containing protein, partial [bacterium]|nr:GGDEF domain-containing protein [bacterium]